MIDKNKVYNMDCLDFLKQIDEESIDLIIIDPPYNINKDSWDKIEDYENWMQKVILEIQRTLKNNGSFYMFHSEIEVVSDFIRFLREDTDLGLKQFIVWNKRFNESKLKGFLDGFVVVDMLRNYQQMAEYILFYIKGIKKDLNIPTESNSVRNYLRKEKKKSRITNKQFNEMFSGFYNKIGCRDRSVIEHYFSEMQWVFPSKEIYEKILQKTGYFQRDYEELKKEYRALGYTFNNQKTHHSVWNYDLISKKDNHITPKPINLIKNIILHSSNEGDLVLDCFMGTGTTAFACKQLNRNFIGCDNNKEYVTEINKKLAQEVLEIANTKSS